MNEQDIFVAAVRIENRESRDDYLSEVCGADGTLRQRIDALLAARERDNSLLDHPLAPIAPTVDGARNWEESNQQIGPYKLREKLGEGGFGVVYVAEQTHPIRRKVALKIVKPGMDSKEVVARFEAERQALALMQHENIAHVLDGGVTSQGRPFFVMELVHGIPITEFCDKNSLPTNRRLKLFQDVCRAVQHAHQKGVIHRDLKPSNVMVTLRDGEPVAKVIDFGVSKALSQQLTEKTIYTRYGQVIGTPQYMSPEQAEMSELGIDTRSDIYSLGVLLYELLTGTPPIDANRLRATGHAEMMRIIREEEPPRPSAKVSTLGDQATVIAEQRRTDPKSLSHSLCGELDWIVMKALDKNRERRYESANQFAADIQCFLANEPVQACPPTYAYRLSKSVRRNRRLVIAASAFMASLFLGLIGTSFGMLQANDEAQRAKTAQEEEIAARKVADERARTLATKNRQLEAAEKLLEAQAADLNSRLYGANMNLAGYARLQLSGLSAVDDLTAQSAPTPEHPNDLRGWEWYFLRSLLEEAERTIPLTSGLYQVGLWTENGTRLISAEADGSWIMKDEQSGTIVSSLPPGTVSIENLSRISPEATRLAVEQGDGTVKIWDLATTRASSELTGIVGKLSDLAWHPNGQHIATLESDGQVRLWDLSTAQSTLTIGAPTGGNGLSWSSDGSQLAHWHRLRSVGLRAWDTGNGQPIGYLTNASEAFNELESDDLPLKGYSVVAWSPNGSLVAVGLMVDSEVHILDAKTGVVRHKLTGHEGHVERLAWSPDSKHLASGGWDKTIMVWDAETGRREDILRGHKRGVLWIHWDPKGKQLISTDLGFTVKVWNTSSELIPKNHGGAIPLLAGRENDDKVFMGWSPTGEEFATKGTGSIQLWDSKTNRLLFSKKSSAWEPGCSDWSPNGRHLAVVHDSSTIMIYDAKTGLNEKEIAVEKAEGLRWGADDEHIAYVSGEEIEILDWRTERVVTTLSQPRGPIAWNPDPKQTCLAAWSRVDQMIHIWSTKTGQILSSVDAKVDFASPSWHPDGTRLAAAFGDGLKAWHWDGKQLIEDFQVSGHSRKAWWSVWSPRENRIATGGQDGTVKIWNAETGQEVFSLSGHKGSPLAFWSPDGKRLATSDSGFVVGAFNKYLWDANKGYAAAQSVADEESRNDP